MSDKNPGVAAPGFFLFLVHGKDQTHRLVTDYISPSNHLLMRWLTTPAATVIKKDMRMSIHKHLLPDTNVGGGNKQIISQPFQLHYTFDIKAKETIHYICRWLDSDSGN